MTASTFPAMKHTSMSAPTWEIDMKESNIKIRETKVYAPFSQCYGKKQYQFKRRAIKDAHSLSADTGQPFTVYHCPHCKQYHIGSVK